MDLNDEQLRKAKEVLAGLPSPSNRLHHDDLVSFVSLQPNLEGFRSHRPYIGPILTKIRYSAFKLLLWIALPIRLALIAQALEISRLRDEVESLKGERS